MNHVPLSVAIYIRVSSEEQVEGYSLEAQLRACRAYAELRGWIVVVFSTIWVQRHEVVAITPTSLAFPLVVAAQKRYSRDSNNQIDGGDSGQGGGSPTGTTGQRGQGMMDPHPAHHSRKPSVNSALGSFFAVDSQVDSQTPADRQGRRWIDSENGLGAFPGGERCHA
ncbi:recombinase family protein [Candidatus Chloroploca sp. Khr17]|uniref:recombinase family protein n=1 Tax=Candidatus Chloroploca sp. Khr17 TaxID=2496869 RepID=UPI00101B6267